MHLLSSRFTLAHYISNVISKFSVRVSRCLNNLSFTHLLALLRRSFEFIVDIFLACHQEYTYECISRFCYGNEMTTYFLTDGNQLYTSMPQSKKYPFEINKRLGAHNFIFGCCGKSFLRRTHQWV
jgi:hypothetical protein